MSRLKCGDLVLFTDETLSFVDSSIKWNPKSFHRHVLEKFNRKTGVVVEVREFQILVLFEFQTVWLLPRYLKKINRGNATIKHI